MKDINKQKEQLLEELAKMRERIHGLEALEKKHKIMEESLKENEETLRKSRERFRSLVETTSDWIWEVDENAVYTYVSPKIRDILGYEPEEILGKTPFDLMPSAEAKRLADIFSSIATSEKPFRELENTNIHKDGRLIVLETSGVPIIDMDGKFCGYRGIDRDITDRKQAENQLRISARELRESNITLKVLLKQRENDKRELEEKILSNIKYIIMPYIEKLKKNKSMSEELAYLNILESNLNEIVSPFSSKLSFKYFDFTPKEIMVTNLIIDGKQDKDITELLNISIDTVKFHRKNIRKKLGIYGKRKNLRSHLLSIIK
jgi:PAS domain S-box-containing protein